MELFETPGYLQLAWQGVSESFSMTYPRLGTKILEDSFKLNYTPFWDPRKFLERRNAWNSYAPFNSPLPTGAIAS
jgi:hypothetical protein